MVRNESDLTAEQVCDKLGVTPKRFGALLKIPCYNTTSHSNGDTNPSLTIYDYNRGYFCFSCSESGSHSWLFKKFGIDDGRYVQHERQNKKVTARPVQQAPEKDYKTYPLEEIFEQLEGLTPDESQVLEAKGFPWQRWESVGWRHHAGQIAGWPQGIFIPYYVDGKLVSARLRNLTGQPRFLGLPGGASFAFQLDKMTSDRVYVCEGETDCLTLNFLGFPAVGVPGSTNNPGIKQIVDKAATTGARLIVVPDNDEAGQKFLDRIRAAAFDKFVAVDVFVVPGYKDVNEWYCAVGQEAFEAAIYAHQGDDIFTEPPVNLTQETLL